MYFNWNSLSRNLLVTGAALMAAGCVAVVPPQEPGASPQAAGSADQANPAFVCTIEGTREQDLSKGTTKALITRSCQQTSLFVENAHAEQNKRCQIVIGDQVSEIYLRPGEGRKLTQTGQVMTSQVRVNCVNDWNRPK